jgi:hypothetical protein
MELHWKKEAARQGYWNRKRKKLSRNLEIQFENILNEQQHALSQYYYEIGRWHAHNSFEPLLEAITNTSNERRMKISELLVNIKELKANNEILSSQLENMSKSALCASKPPKSTRPVAIKVVSNRSESIFIREVKKFKNLVSFLKNLENPKLLNQETQLPRKWEKRKRKKPAKQE